MHQRHPAEFVEELGNVLPHEEEAAAQRSRETDIPDEYVRVCVNCVELVKVHPLRMTMCLYQFNFIIGRQTRTK